MNEIKLVATRNSGAAWLQLAALALLLFTASTAFGIRRERRIDTWRPTHYNVQLTLNNELSELRKARTEITILTLKPGVSVIDLDFGELSVDSVTLNKREMRFKQSSGLLQVNLARAVGIGTRLEVVVTYHGVPKDGLIMSRDKSGNPAVVGDNWPNRVHHWIPSLDHPSAKATVTFSVTAPEKNLVVANGKLLNTQNTFPAMRTWNYSEAVPIPPYCMIFAAGQFAKFTVQSPITPLEYYVPRADEPFALKGFAPASPSLELFDKTVGQYPYEKLALIVGATQFGGMENSGAIVFGSNLFNPVANPTLSPTFGVRRGLVQLVAHEIAHQWFGDSVTQNTWSDLWLSEGFATYFAGFFVQKHDGEAAFRQYMKGAADTYFAFAKQRRIPLHDVETEDLFKLLNGNSYQKGAWILHMLRSQLGDEAFFQGLRAYYATHKNSTATSEDLRVALEKASGENLKPFFASWIYGAGHPSYELTWSWNAERRSLRVSLKQTQAESAFPNWLPLNFVTAAGTKRIVLKPGEKNFLEEFPMNEAPTSLEADPDETVLKELIVRPLAAGATGR